ncbi:MAG: hypothetical protein GC191_11055 [Azospirillum sp.]|nr:hypothetical protein [Azospirillum sp.]
MSSVHRYLFEQDFDSESPSAIRRKAQKEAEAPPPPPPPTFSEAQLTAAEKKARAAGEAAGRAEGHRAGRAEAEAEIAALTGQALGRLADGIAALIAARAETNAERTVQPLQIAMKVIETVLPDLIRRHGSNEIQAAIMSCLHDLIDEPRLSIRVHDDLVEPMRERLERLAEARGFAGRLVVLNDPALGPADCRVEWANGGAERNTGELLAEIERAAGRLTDLG